MPTQNTSSVVAKRVAISSSLPSPACRAPVNADALATFMVTRNVASSGLLSETDVMSAPAVAWPGVGDSYGHTASPVGSLTVSPIRVTPLTGPADAKADGPAIWRYIVTVVPVL